MHRPAFRSQIGIINHDVAMWRALISYLLKPLVFAQACYYKAGLHFLKVWLSSYRTISLDPGRWLSLRLAAIFCPRAEACRCADRIFSNAYYRLAGEIGEVSVLVLISVRPLRL